MKVEHLTAKRVVPQGALQKRPLTLHVLPFMPQAKKFCFITDQEMKLAIINVDIDPQESREVTARSWLVANNFHPNGKDKKIFLYPLASMLSITYLAIVSDVPNDNNRYLWFDMKAIHQHLYAFCGHAKQVILSPNNQKIFKHAENDNLKHLV